MKRYIKVECCKHCIRRNIQMNLTPGVFFYWVLGHRHRNRGRWRHMPARFCSKERSPPFIVRNYPLFLKETSALEVSLPQVWDFSYIPVLGSKGLWIGGTGNKIRTSPLVTKILPEIRTISVISQIPSLTLEQNDYVNLIVILATRLTLKAWQIALFEAAIFGEPGSFLVLVSGRRSLLDKSRTVSLHLEFRRIASKSMADYEEPISDQEKVITWWFLRLEMPQVQLTPLTFRPHSENVWGQVGRKMRESSTFVELAANSTACVCSLKLIDYKCLQII